MVNINAQEVADLKRKAKEKMTRETKTWLVGHVFGEKLELSVTFDFVYLLGFTAVAMTIASLRFTKHLD